ncbi:hypothetical protein [Vibrio crassostreae]|uniref:hypothetical protein n=1 Tax=Vibrio crassostreae TaxID=246167 RepID=UPI001042EB42|nr:hypothetical protein [Vibrio crassostreae]
MKTVQRLIFPLLIGVSSLFSGFLVQANSCEAVECIYLSGSVGVAVGKYNEKKDDIFRLGGNYQWGEYLAFGVNSVFISNQDGQQDSFGVDGVLRGFVPVGDKARLYGDAGVVSFGEEHLTLGGGILYRIVRQLELDIGYRYYGKLSPEQGDVYAATVGMQYHFSSPLNPIADSTQLRPSQITTSPKPKPRVFDSLALGCPTSWTSSEQFTQNLEQTTYVYKINQGDWALKIARSHCTTLAVLMALNPWLIDRLQNEQYIHPQETLIVPKLL